MSLKRISRITPDVLNIVIYSKSASVDLYIRKSLKESFGVESDYIVNVDKDKELKNAKMDAMMEPFTCPYWLIHVDADKISKNELLKSLGQTPTAGKTVYWTSNYGTYMRMMQSSELKEQQGYSPTYTFSRLSDNDIKILHEGVVREKRRLQLKELLYVMKYYSYEPQLIMDLFRATDSGRTIASTKDIIDTIGLPGSSVATLALKMLKLEPKTEKYLNIEYKRTVRYIENISVKLDYRSLKNFLLSNIEGFIEMKQLQMMGLYRAQKFIIPEGFDEKRINRLKRFERQVLNDVSMQRLLNLKLALTSLSTFNPEVDVMHGVALYFSKLLPTN